MKLKVIPNYREMQGIVIDSLDFSRETQLSILEVGSGTGLWALRLLNLYPNAHYYGIDLSKKMLEIAQYRLKKFRKRVRLERFDLNSQNLEGKYDFVTSFFTIHHVKNKKKLMRQIYSILNDGGIFVNADIIKAPNRKLEEHYMEKWKNFMIARKNDSDRIRRIIDDHLVNDIPEPIYTHLKFMDDAGFGNSKLLFNDGKFAIFYGRK